MIVVTGEIELDAEHVWPATTAAAKMIEASEKEPGCILYRFYVDITNTRRFRIYEEWVSQEALETHFKTAHMAEFQTALAGFRVLNRRIVTYEVTNERTL